MKTLRLGRDELYPYYFEKSPTTSYVDFTLEVTKAERKWIRKTMEAFLEVQSFLDTRYEERRGR